jgi:hypothetical protein
LLKKIRKVGKKIFRPIAQTAVGAIPGVGPALSTNLFSGGGGGSSSFLPAVIGGGARVALPRVIPGAGAAVGGAVGVGARVAGRSATTIARSAIAWCKRNPAWCASIGGTAAVEALVASGDLPVIKRRRARGVSASELKAFRRVASIVRQHAPTARKVPCKPRGTVCR